MVDVNSDETPITHQKIDQVDASTWKDKSLSELYDDLIIMNRRLDMAREVGNITIIQQVQKGIEHLQAVINARGPSETKLI